MKNVCEEKNVLKLCSTGSIQAKAGGKYGEEIVHRFEDTWAICWGLMGTGSSGGVRRRILKSWGMCDTAVLTGIRASL